MKKRSHKKKSGGSHHKPKEKTTPRVMPTMLNAPPLQCPKCGNAYIGTFTEQEASFIIRMARCIGSLGGCGKTWRLI
jgi:hypothetical protein